MNSGITGQIKPYWEWKRLFTDFLQCCLRQKELNIMKEKITLCGDNCFAFPRYTAKSEEELKVVAELWCRVGWRDKVVSSDEMRCTGCSSHKQCTYHLVECIAEHNVQKCNQCIDYPCQKIDDMLKRSGQYRKKAKEVCSEAEYRQLEAAFFDKKMNLDK